VCPDSSFFRCLSLGLTFESFEELGMRHPRWDKDKWQVGQLFTRTCTNLTSWLVHSWSTFGAQMNHKQTRTHKTHHSPDLGEATTFPLIVFSMPNHEANNQMSFCPWTPKFLELGLPWLWRPITFCADLRLRWGLKKSCSSCQGLFKVMLQITWTQINQGDFWLLMVESQIENLTPGLSFGHNLCFKYPNGSCDSILNIYVLRAFQWYKELFNPISFDPYNFSLKNWKSIGIPIPKVGAHLGVWRFIPSHCPTLMGAWILIPGLHFWLATLQAFALITSPRLGLQHSRSTWRRFKSLQVFQLNWLNLARSCLSFNFPNILFCFF
jgi:hypothetical protein